MVMTTSVTAFPLHVDGMSNVVEVASVLRRPLCSGASQPVAKEFTMPERKMLLTGKVAGKRQLTRSGCPGINGVEEVGEVMDTGSLLKTGLVMV